ncbi:MAG: enoyl-CoA hydratase [Candidatus Puniceispirillaceae bacterium]|jgi:enoyl-CoA hydratase
MTDEIIISVDQHIATVTLNRPEARNALTFGMYQALSDLCQQAGTAKDDRAIKAIVICGAGEKAFAAGTDIGQFTSFKTLQDGHDYEAQIESVIRSIETCRVPVIAALHGAVTGGGLVIAAAAHLRLASADVKIGMPIARTLGNCLAITNLRRLVALFGEARVAHMILTAELLSADQALASGFVHDVLQDRDTMLARATALAQRLTTMAPLTIQSSLDGLRRLRHAAACPDDSDLIAACYTSEDFAEGVAAFLEKRKPNWHGR